MTTKLEKRASAAIEAWCKDRKIKLLNPPRHVHPRAYVVGYAAPQCLIIANPWVDSEPQCRGFDRENPLVVVRTFDIALEAGDWCTCGYVCRDGIQEQIAIPVVP